MNSLKYYFHATTGYFFNSVFENIFLTHLFPSISTGYPGLRYYPCFPEGLQRPHRSLPSTLIPCNFCPHFNQNEFVKTEQQQQKCYPVVSDILLIDLIRVKQDDSCSVSQFALLQCHSYSQGHNIFPISHTQGNCSPYFPKLNLPLMLLGERGCRRTTFNHFILFLLFQSAPLRPITPGRAKSSNFILIRSGLGLKQLCTDEILIITHICTYYPPTFNFLLSNGNGKVMLIF